MKKLNIKDRAITTKTFADYNLNEQLLSSLKAGGFKAPTPIQEMTITPILEGKDIFALAETGSGKTGSFAIPMLEQIMRDDKHGEIHPHESVYLVLSPTRELAQQTDKVFHQFGDSLGIRSCSIIGGESIDKQKEMIDQGIHVLVATPGRMVDLLKQKMISLEHCQGVVFDEADRMFDMGFQKDIEFILSKISNSRQLIMVSATTNMEVMNTAYKFHSQPIELKLNEDSLLVDGIDHQIAMISQKEKMPLLVGLLRQEEDHYAIVFCNTQFQTHLVAEWLKKMGFKAKPISGRLAQNKRTKLMDEFRSKQVTILVCTDVAARGLDIKNVSLVVNYDIPQEAANYVHRIGRTGRAGEKGHAISFCAHEDCEYIDAIYDFIGDTIEKFHGEEELMATDLCGKPFIDRKTLRVDETRGGRISVEKRSRGKGNERRERSKQDENMRGTRVDRENVTVEAPKRTSAAKVAPKSLELTSTNIDDAKLKAKKALGIEDNGLVGYEILSQGKKKFFFFGPRETKYRFYIRPIYKRLITPFLIELLKRAKLNLYVRVSFREPVARVVFSGKDEKLLTRNNSELLYAFEHVIKQFLYRKIDLPRGFKVNVSCGPDQKRQEKYLTDLADNMKQRVIDGKKPVLLKELSPVDRRIVHQYLDEDPDVKTTSIGDGRFKKIEISLR